MKKLIYLLLLLVLLPQYSYGVTRLYDRQAGDIIDADKDDAEFDNTNNAINTHEADTAAHSATGGVVGVSKTQTLTNKSLTSPTITGAPTAAGATWVDLGTASLFTATSATITSFVATTASITSLTATDIVSNSIPPLGSIIPFYDFDAALTFNSSYWAYCDGSSKTITGVGAKTLPDLSNRYLVGFGTEGGGDIDSASWATTAVGNASHQVDIQHAHTMTGHTHTGPSHLHTTGDFTLLEADIPSHTHGTSIKVRNDIPNVTVTGATTAYEADAAYSGTYVTTATGGGTAHNHGNTGSSGTAATGSTTDTMNNQLSTTQSIQPRSIRVRYIMRIR